MTGNTQHTAHGQTSKSMALPQNITMGHYRLLRMLGLGGFGITYLAIDQRTNAQVVIKENLPAFYAVRDDATKQIQPLDVEGAAQNYNHMLRLFVDEARTLSHLKHPNIVRVYGVFEALGTAYYVMPYIPGKELHKVMHPAAVSEAWLQPILVALLSALDYLHSYNLLHRDLEPGNILLREDGTPILIEFGTARALQTERSAPMVGTPAYSPPEQISPHGTCGPWTDIYALGATCYRIITGECPPQALDRLFDVDPYRPLASRPELLGRFSPALLSSIDTALAVSYKHRWPDARRWMEALHTLPPEWDEAASSGKSGKWLLLAGALTLLLGGAGYGVYAYAESVKAEQAKAEQALAETMRLRLEEAERVQRELDARRAGEEAALRDKETACAEFIQQLLQAHSEAALPAKKHIPKPQSKQLLHSLREMAEKNDAAAKFAYSVLLMHGVRVQQDKTKALQYLREAAEAGHPVAQTALGCRYATGAELSKDPYEAVKWYTKAALQGYAGAQNNLGSCYAAGYGVSKDMDQAAEWFRKAAQQGIAVAQYNLAYCYQNGVGTTENAQEAVKWFHEAAKQGLADAQYSIGLCYLQAYGISRDEKEAAEWFYKAAKQGLTMAQCHLAWCYYHGNGVSKDLQEAVKWYRKAADAGSAPAQYCLGICYYRGDGVPKDDSEALSLIRKAADQGYSEAQNALDSLNANH